jgi:polysaccharide export outer membrane protein
MRPSRLLSFVVIALATTGCAVGPGGRLPSDPQAQASSSGPAADLDTLLYTGASGKSQSAATAMAAASPETSAASRATRDMAAGPNASTPSAAAAQAMAAESAVIVTAAPPPAIAPAGEGNQPYALDAGDRLRVVVFGQDGLSNSYVVDAAGRITMPLIGAVLARGLTPPQLSQAVAERLRRGFVREPHVAIEVEGYRPFFILGEVLAPGQYPYVPNMTAETAVAIAGGFSPRAYYSDVMISRAVNGQTVRFKVPLRYWVRPGDTITVTERWF